MASISNLGYLVLGVKTEAWKQFAVDTLACNPGAGPANAGARMDDCEQRIVLERHDGDDMLAAGGARAGRFECPPSCGSRWPCNRATRRWLRRPWKTCTADPNGIRHGFDGALAPAWSTLSFPLVEGGFHWPPGGHFVAAANDARNHLCKQLQASRSVTSFVVSWPRACCWTWRFSMLAPGGTTPWPR